MVSEEHGTLIAVGNTAEVYEAQPGWVLKLFKENYSRGAVEYELRIHQAVQQAGIPVPKAGDAIIDVDGRFGILYEKVNGLPMAQVIQKQPWKMRAYARKLAELHVQMHAEPLLAEGLPTIRERLNSRIAELKEMPENYRTILLQRLDELPDGDRLCHGDFHVENVLVDGEDFYIIDWVDATIGSPMADVARTTVILLGAAAGLPSKILRWMVRRLHAVYLQEYIRLAPFDREEYERWLPVIAVARLTEGIAEQQDWLIEQAKKIVE